MTDGVTSSDDTERSDHEIVEKTLGRETKLVCERCRQYADDVQSFDNIDCRWPEMGHLAEAADS